MLEARAPQFPAAGPTESSASTNGTPAAKVVASVLLHRAIDAFCSISPNTGSFSKAARQNFVSAELEGFAREMIVTLAREGRL